MGENRQKPEIRIFTILCLFGTLFQVFFDWLAEKNYWFCILTDEDEKEFDCWVVDLEPDKKKPQQTNHGPMLSKTLA